MIYYRNVVFSTITVKKISTVFSFAKREEGGFCKGGTIDIDEYLWMIIKTVIFQLSVANKSQLQATRNFVYVPYDNHKKSMEYESIRQSISNKKLSRISQ